MSYQVHFLTWSLGIMGVIFFFNPYRDVRVPFSLLGEKGVIPGVSNQHIPILWSAVPRPHMIALSQEHGPSDTTT